jgi:hypothetical protein
VGGLPRHAHLPGGRRDGLAGLHALAEGATAYRGEPCVRMLGHGGTPFRLQT